MGATGNRARDVAEKFSGFATLITKPTIVLAAKPVEKFLLIEVCPACCDRTGHVRWKSSKLSSATRGRTEIKAPTLAVRTAKSIEPSESVPAHSLPAPPVR